MSAKSAPQLVSPLNHARSAAMHVRGTLFILALALLMASAGWLLDHAKPELLAAAPAPQSELLGGDEPAAAVAPAALAAAAPTHAEAENPPAENRRYRALSQFLAKRYRVSQAVTLDLVTMAHAAGHQLGVDPLLIIAVISVESRFNPIAESVAGAKGLMQIIPKYHPEKFQEHGGAKAVFDPQTNILVGSQIIKEYLLRTGNLNSALQLYGGATSDENDAYFGKVMSEKERLHQVLRTRS
jgi:soluble lytic murein transglycosylase-like protein